MKKVVLCCLSLVMVGCQSTQPLYYWGDYETIIYTSYENTGEMPVRRQIEKLQSIVAAAEAANQQPAPGIFAQLGVAFVENGNKVEAREWFKKEATLYPESNAFMNYLLDQLQQQDEKL